ncbi:MAG: penicillin-binding transpeptidase domain-containing protein, partial [Candidatus Taylorbacteria bacterium]|nr:penicillin-binding transpeptidase domain-containing protein [Candidatus Taylorbacteria bacterium]
IYDRDGVLLDWNAPSARASDDRATKPASSTIISTAIDSGDEMVARREYSDVPGLAHILGYVKYPSKDNNGFYYRDDFEGIDGAEQYFNAQLQGKNGSRLIEVDALGHIISQNIIRPPEQGNSVTLSIDSKVQSALYDNIKDVATRVGFSGGAGVIMDIRTGEVLALTSYPEYDPQLMSDGTDSAAIRSTLNDQDLPFLDRATDGLYTPGSIMKPYIALGALNENVIDPSTIIVTTGSVSIQNPYDPTKSTVFKDWKNLGALDMRHAIAMSSDAYFYTVGGGYKDQKGLGIANIDKYLSMFGFGESIPDSFVTGKAGLISTPAWKRQTFNEDWFLGDTYHTAIGQYGTQVTPIQVARAVSAIANDGDLLVPTIVKGDGPKIERKIDLPQSDFNVIHEGMRLGTEIGTSVALNVPYVKIAGKSGTAELGASRANVNSWITGFWPYEDPHYAFAVMLEKGSTHNLIGAAATMRQVLDQMERETPEYFK